MSLTEIRENLRIHKDVMELLDEVVPVRSDWRVRGVYSLKKYPGYIVVALDRTLSQGEYRGKRIGTNVRVSLNDLNSSSGVANAAIEQMLGEAYQATAELLKQQ